MAVDDDESCLKELSRPHRRRFGVKETLLCTVFLKCLGYLGSMVIDMLPSRAERLSVVS